MRVLPGGFWAGAVRRDRAGLWRVALERAGGEAGDVSKGLLAGVLADGRVAQPAEAAAAWLAEPYGVSRGEVLLAVDPRYPAGLAALEAAPPAVFVEGALSALAQPGVGVVGTRRASGPALVRAETLGVLLAREGQVVVSGLARGVDAAAHRGALSAGQTVAVLGHGLGLTSPVHHAGLRQALLAAGGAVLSSFEDEAPALGWRFLERNRWIAAMSRAVVVVEAPVRSGALSTAKHARALKRPVIAGVGPEGGGAGCVALAATGAVAAAEVWQVLALIGLAPGSLRRVGVPVKIGGATGAKRETIELGFRRVVAGEAVEEAAQAAGIGWDELGAVLLRAELAGAVVRRPGGRYALHGGAGD